MRTGVGQSVLSAPVFRAERRRFDARAPTIHAKPHPPTIMTEYAMGFFAFFSSISMLTEENVAPAHMCADEAVAARWGACALCPCVLHAVCIIHWY